MTNLFQLAYVSTASEHFDKVTLRDMLKEFNQRNTKAGITGTLLYMDGQFMQVLEGMAEAVTATFNRIRRDPRHHGIIILLQGAVQERRFSAWSMAFRDFSLPMHEEVSAFSEFLNTPLIGEEIESNTDRCEKLLLGFKKNIR